MTGSELRQSRTRRGWTQQQAAARFGVTQAYLSMLENERRPVPGDLALKFARQLEVPATALPLENQKTIPDLAAALGSLGYPGFAYHRGPRVNPAVLLVSALAKQDLDTRVTEALPWLLLTYGHHMDWDWILTQVKLEDRQNRLGYLVQLALKTSDPGNPVAQKLRDILSILERSRLAAEDTLCRESMTQAERNWLRRHRPLLAKHWNLLTDLEPEYLHEH